MTEREITLFQGTDAVTAEGTSDIYGKVNKDIPNLSGNWTDNFETAREFALFRVGNQPGLARVMEVRLPLSEVEIIGGILNHEGQSYATTDHVSVAQVPPEYLRKACLLIGDINFLKDDPSGREFFYRVRRKDIKTIYKVRG